MHGGAGHGPDRSHRLVRRQVPTSTEHCSGTPWRGLDADVYRLMRRAGHVGERRVRPTARVKRLGRVMRARVRGAW